MTSPLNGRSKEVDITKSLQKVRQEQTSDLHEGCTEMGNGDLGSLLRNGSAALKPFVHQVTGRSHMLSLNSGTICKSLLPRELLFYANIPDDLRPYVPELKGVLYAKLEESDVGGEFKFSTKQVFVKSNVDISQRDGCWQNRTTGVQEGCSTPTDAYKKVLFKGLERFKYDMASGFKSHPWTVDKDAEAITEFMGANPWSVRQHRREINRMLSLDGPSPHRKRFKTPADSDKQHGHRIPNSHGSMKFLRGYLMLEDVTAGFRHPNVIDFKLGRQIERDDCSQEKKNKHVELAKNSSTGTIMLRLAGMQVYQVNSDHYLCLDKYYGRGLSSSGLTQSIKQFLNNGVRALVEVVPPLISKLRSLLSILEKQKTFRFYASSLLILYEGDNCNNVEDCQISSTAPKGNGKSASGFPILEFERKIEVRMIDFAHSTYEGFNGDRTSHEGPDLDCLHALSNLIEILVNVEQICITEQGGNLPS